MSSVCRSGRGIPVAAAALAAVLIGIDVQSSLAYERYTDGCHLCHGNFDGPDSPKGTVFPSDSKHEMHRATANMDTDCLLCHINPGDNPLTYQSAGTADTPGFGCAGCHGRDYGGNHPECVGLRQHHLLHGITVCQGCHDDPAPLPESVNPPYYGSPDTKADDSCNSGPAFLENWSVGDTEGLDNDGDDLYDGNDPDCSAGRCPCDCESPPDGTVDVGDFLAMLAQWGTPGPCDCEDPPDGTVDVGDFLAMLAAWGPCP